MSKTGLGSDVVFATSAWDADIISIAPGAITRGETECTALSTTGQKKWDVNTLVEFEVWTMVVHYDPNDPPPFQAAAELITITFPLQPSQSVNPKLAGTGYITSFTPPTLTADDRMEATIQIRFDGDGTPAVFTDGAT